MARAAAASARKRALRAILICLRFPRVREKQSQSYRKLNTGIFFAILEIFLSIPSNPYTIRLLCRLLSDTYIIQLIGTPSALTSNSNEVFYREFESGPCAALDSNDLEEAQVMCHGSNLQ
jgi:hypothetical protein